MPKQEKNKDIQANILKAHNRVHVWCLFIRFNLFKTKKEFLNGKEDLFESEIERINNEIKKIKKEISKLNRKKL